MENSVGFRQIWLPLIIIPNTEVYDNTLECNGQQCLVSCLARFTSEQYPQQKHAIHIMSVDLLLHTITTLGYSINKGYPPY